MLTFEQYIEKYIKQPTLKRLELTEASMGRLWQHYEKGDVIAIISSDRSERSNRENIEKYKDLKYQIARYGFGYNKARGGYVETITLDDGTTKQQEVDGERSVIVYCSPEEQDQLFNLIKHLGRVYDQECVLLVDKNKQASWFYTNNSSNGKHKRGNIIKLGKFHPQRIGMFFTKIGKKNFSFETIEEQQQYKWTSVEKFNNIDMRKDLNEITEQGLDYDTVIKQRFKENN